jgi:membrane protein YqaA with SNARE-associated domain
VVTLLVLATILRPVRRHVTSSTWNYGKLLRTLGGVSLFLVAILDSSPLPTFGGPDILTAIFAARHKEPWYYYAAMTTAGSVVGAYITFHMARRAGSSYLKRKFGEERISKLLAYFERWGTGALAVSTALPLPFPTSAFFAAAGVLNYSTRTFLIVVTFSRAARYAVIAAIASAYGRRFVRVVGHPQLYIGWLILIAAVIAAFVAASVIVRKQFEMTTRKA